MTSVRSVWVLAAALALAACTGQKTRPSSVPQAAGSTTGQEGADSRGMDVVSAGVVGTESGGAGALASAGDLGSQRVIYFDYDSAEIRPEYIDVVAAHGRFLAGNASVRVRLEGNTDERGSREYNIGLGERRAQTLRRALALQGVRDSQLSTVSYGEERPAVAGSDESAYARNRRVEIVYIN
ncbi:MAG: hypothetical protein RL026_2211 [Pseudomonadota bacterium]|jgi:peptidoglycan-associated lipoprotein